MARLQCAALIAVMLVAAGPPPHRVPLPRPNPFHSLPSAAPAAPAQTKAAAPAQTKAAAPTPAPDRPNIVVTAGAACTARLHRLGVVFTAKPAFKKGACSIAVPVEVTALAGGIRVTPPALLGCAEAESLARWMAEVVTPTAKAAFHAAPMLIGQASAYECRTRDRIKGARLSEHATGNAVDIARIGFGDHPAVEIGHPDGAAGAAFQTAIRRGACDYFTTVLGPGDAYHATHLHLDREARRSGFRLCE